MPAVVCPQCQFHGTVPDHFAGQTVRCPKCKGRIAIPPPPEPVTTFTEVIEEPVAPIVAIEPEKPRKFLPALMCPHCNFEGDLPESFVGPSVRCPQCKKLIQLPQADQAAKAPLPQTNQGAVLTRHDWRGAGLAEKAKEGEALAQGCVEYVLKFFLRIALFGACCFLCLILFACVVDRFK